MAFDVNQIVSYREMCNEENQQQIQHGMNFMAGGNYSIVLMSVKPNAPYADRMSEDGLTIFYEGHDAPGDRTKRLDQPEINPSGTLTRNGLFKEAIEKGKKIGIYPLARVYEKLHPGIWTYRGLFEMRDSSYIVRRGRSVFEFILTITDQKIEKPEEELKPKDIDLEQTRQIPGKVKLAVFKRDHGQCRKCDATDNLHFDHILPYSKGGTSLKEENIQLLCARHNLEKSAHIDK